MEKFLLNYAWEIMDLAKEQHIETQYAVDMFCENLLTYEKGKPVHYDGAAVDYDLVAPKFVELGFDGQADAKIAFKNMHHDLYDTITKCRRENDKLTFYSAIANYQMEEKPMPDLFLFNNAWDIWNDAEANGISLTEAKDKFIEASDTFNGFADSKKKQESEWFDAKVVSYDMGLKYARMTGNRSLFESILASR